MIQQRFSCVRRGATVAFASGDHHQTHHVKIRFQIKQKLDYGRRLAVVGSPDELGTWNVSKTTAALQWHEGNIWSGETSMKPGPVEFKLVVVSDDDVIWPDGDNVSLLIPESAEAIDVTGEEGGLNLTILGDVQANVEPHSGDEGRSQEVLTSVRSSSVDTLTADGGREELSLRFLQSLKVAELKAMCKERGLAVSGKKADLIERLTTVS